MTTLHEFCAGQLNCTEGYLPNWAPTQAKDGNFYGVTTMGGNANNGGTIYKMTASGTLTTLYSFCAISGCPDGSQPLGGIMQGTDGNFYGTTFGNAGTIFEFIPPSTLSTLYNFCTQPSCTDGAAPFGGLLQDTNGILYGTTVGGGTGGIGTVFSLSLPQFGAFVIASPANGKVGMKVTLLGSNLTGTTAVSFNGAAATFTVATGGGSINTSVPAGATTGTITVTTSSGPVTSTVPFKVTPQIKSFTPSSGSVGSSVTITGVSLTQTSKITFGGVKAISFTVDSDTQVRVTVPTGAKTGKIVITTPGGTAVSLATFTVM